MEYNLCNDLHTLCNKFKDDDFFIDHDYFVFIINTQKYNNVFSYKTIKINRICECISQRTIEYIVLTRKLYNVNYNIKNRLVYILDTEEKCNKFFSLYTDDDLYILLTSIYKNNVGINDDGNVIKKTFLYYAIIYKNIILVNFILDRMFKLNISAYIPFIPLKNFICRNKTYYQSRHIRSNHIFRNNNEIKQQIINYEKSLMFKNSLRCSF